MRVSGIGLCGLVLLWACTSSRAPPAPAPTGRADCANQADGVMCTEAGHALTCASEALLSDTDCNADDQICDPTLGCVVCSPGTAACDGNERTVCRDDGSGYDALEGCEDGLFCSAQGCLDLCAKARADRSYIGCEYFPVFTSNSRLDPSFAPAVVVANPNLVAADVTLQQGVGEAIAVSVPPGGVETVMLTYTEGLRSASGSRIVRGGAYHLLSSVPVTVHQFNPLRFEVDRDCVVPDPNNPAPAGKCYSYSNDASLLLPAHVLSRGEGEGTAYLAMARASLLFGPDEKHVFDRSMPDARSPGMLAIVGAGSGPVQVRIKSSAYTLGSIVQGTERDAGDAGTASDASPDGDAGSASDAGPDGDAGSASDAGTDGAAGVAAGDEGGAAGDEDAGDTLPALAPGDTLGPITLMPGDVLQLLSDAPDLCPTDLVETRRPGQFACAVGGEYDLTGTEVMADGPIGLIGGHDCAYVPFDRTACDHLEETLFPLETWGTDVLVPRPRSGLPVPHRVRVLSGADDNEVRFDPESEHAAITLARGESFELETTEHLRVQADKPILVGQFLVGQNGESRVGDPSMSIAIPVEQYRSSYAFLSPDSYALNYVSIIALAGDVVLLDGTPVTSFADIGDGTFRVAAVSLARSGAHEVHSERGQTLGLVIYGYGDYTSYMLPGGLDLRIVGIVY